MNHEPTTSADAGRPVEPSTSAPPPAAETATISQTGESDRGRQTFPTDAFGDYDQLYEIAKGGMGVVYRARQRSLNRPVAVKMILAGVHATTEQLQRFRAEAEAAAALDHPSIVPVYEIGENEGRPYFSMALVDGGSLKDRLNRGPLPPHVAASVVAQAARAVQHAHVHNIIHRDLKPGNILLTGDGAPKITDFGLAKMANAGNDLTQTGQGFGTPGYMAPEQANAKEAGPAADVYGLGATLYCTLVGRAPFHAASPTETLRQTIEQEPVQPRKFNAAVPPDLETICLKCLRKEPARRYASAGALADDLERFLRGETIHARPVGVTEKAIRWGLRHVAVTVLSASLLLAMALGCAGTIWQLNVALQAERIRAQEERARQAEERGRLADNARSGARLASQRGSWKIALQQCDAAAQAGLNDDVEVMLMRAVALMGMGLGERKEAGRLIDALLRRSDLGRWSGLVHKTHGDLLFVRDAAGAHAAYRTARTLLTDHDEGAKAALDADDATDLPSWTAAMKRSLEADPAQPQVHFNLAIGLLALGRTAEARRTVAAGRALFPEEPELQMVDAAARVCENDLRGALAVVDAAPFPKADRETLAMVFRHADRARRLTPRILMADAAAFGEAFALSLETAPLVALANDNQLSLTRIFPLSPKLHEIVWEQLTPLADAWRANSPFQAAAAPKTLSESRRAGVALERMFRYEGIAKICPEGTILSAHGASLLIQGRIAEARAVLEQAKKSPAICDMQKPILTMLLMADALEYPTLADVPGSQRSKVERQARRNFDALIATTPPYQLNPAKEALVLFAAYVGAWGPAKLLFEEARASPSTPDMDGTLILAHALLAFHDGDFDAAERLAAQFLSLPPIAAAGGNDGDQRLKALRDLPKRKATNLLDEARRMKSGRK